MSSNVTCADSIYEYTRAQRDEYVSCTRRKWLIVASVATGVLFLILIAVILFAFSVEDMSAALIGGGAFVVLSGIFWSIYGASGLIANSSFDKHDRKIELALNAAPNKSEAQVLIELRQAEINQRNFETAVSRRPISVYGYDPSFYTSY